MDIFVLILKNLKLISLFSLLGHRVVSSFNTYILKPIPDYNLILLIAINKSVFVVQQRMSLSFLELGFSSQLVQFVLCLILQDKIFLFFPINKALYINKAWHYKLDYVGSYTT